MNRLSRSARIFCTIVGIFSVVAMGSSGFNSISHAADEHKRELVACALTFDDGPGDHTEQLLDILKERRVVATFFLVGEMVQRRPQIARRMAAEGHEVDNHSFDHPDLRHLSFARQKAEIAKTDRALRELGIVPKYFRPPYGSYNGNTVRAAAQNGLTLVLWTDDALDWKYHSVHSIESHLESHLRRKVGGIYLFHDLHSWTVAAMPEIISDLTMHGCRFVTLEDYMGKKSVPADVTTTDGETKTPE